MGIVDRKTTKAFRTCANKGFHLKFPNGWIVSIQFGGGNYSDNYDLLFNSELYLKKPDLESDTAEVWAWNEKGHCPKEPLANQTISEVLKFINKVAKKKLKRVQ